MPAALIPLLLLFFQLFHAGAVKDAPVNGGARPFVFSTPHHCIFQQPHQARSRAFLPSLEDTENTEHKSCSPAACILPGYITQTRIATIFHHPAVSPFQVPVGPLHTLFLFHCSLRV
ncbi:hypothetical protein DCC81_19420 [Chitinophaga parva]|uniref:Secreted protein n=1 Tax=Chitinophaga parva TaxID=2169414 RepID=A0A2T7BBY4_9BACT|nr:hypothetical protein DCC81_19420 [Chitinophaga parva]